MAEEAGLLLNRVWFAEHYTQSAIESMAAVRRNFPEDAPDGAYELNWLFLSTSGVHGTYETLDDLEAELTAFEHNPRAWQRKHEVGSDYHPSITVLIVRPRTCVMLHGHIPIERSDIPYLRHVVARTLDGVRRSQAGNLPTQD